MKAYMAILDNGRVEAFNVGFKEKPSSCMVMKLYSPTARPGALIEALDALIFIPFDRKIAYSVSKKWDGWKAEEISQSEVEDWKSMTKAMGDLKQRFVKLFDCE